MKFREQQKFRRWDILLLLGLLLAGTLYRIIDYYIIQHQHGSDGYLYFSLLALFVLMVTIVLLLSFRLITKIDEKGVYYQFFPWHYRKHKIDWDEVSEYRVVETPLPAELSGWTVNVGTQELTYSFYGRTGLMLRLKDGRQIFIGTCCPEKLRKAMHKIKKESGKVLQESTVN